MINKLIEKLSCPCCTAPLFISSDGKSLFCQGEEKRHCYDISAAGHVNLLAGHHGVGDSKEAVRARSEFLDAGYYSPLADKLCVTLKEYLTKGSCIIDAGCGEGYYTGRLVDNGYNAIGFDISKYAVMAAAKRRSRNRAENNSSDAFFATAGIFKMPVSGESFDGLVNIFAPFAEEEFFRTVKQGGIIAAVSPGAEHLAGLKGALYQNVTENEERNDLPKNKKIFDKINLKYGIIVEGGKMIQNLFAMTPYFWRTSREDAAKLTKLERLETKLDFVITIYRV